MVAAFGGGTGASSSSSSPSEDVHSIAAALCLPLLAFVTVAGTTGCFSFFLPEADAFVAGGALSALAASGVCIFLLLATPFASAVAAIAAEAFLNLKLGSLLAAPGDSIPSSALLVLALAGLPANGEFARDEAAEGTLEVDAVELLAFRDMATGAGGAVALSSAPLTTFFFLVVLPVEGAILATDNVQQCERVGKSKRNVTWLDCPTTHDGRLAYTKALLSFARSYLV